MFYSGFYHVSNALETKQVIAILKIADPYSFPILRFLLAFKVRKERKNSTGYRGILSNRTANIILHILELSF